MTPALFQINTEEAFDLFNETVIQRADDLYDLDGETAFRRCGGVAETFDIELGLAGGLS